MTNNNNNQTFVAALALLNRHQSLGVNEWGAPYLLGPEVAFASSVFKRIFNPTYWSGKDFGDIVHNTIFEIRKDCTQDSKGHAERIRNVVATSVMAYPESISFVLDYKAWGKSTYPYPPILPILMGALEAMLTMEDDDRVTPETAPSFVSIFNDVSSIADILGSKLALLASAGREFGWNLAKRIGEGEIEQNLSKLIAKVIERYGDIFVSYFLRPFRDFPGGFQENDFVPLVDWVVRQVTIKHLARHPTSTLLQICVGNNTK